MNKINILPLLLMILCVFNVQAQEEAVLTWASKSENHLDLNLFFADQKNYQEYLANIRTKDSKIPEIIIKKSWAKLPENLKSWNVDWMPRDLFNTSPSLYNLILSGNLNVHSDILEYFQSVAKRHQSVVKRKRLAEEAKMRKESWDLARALARQLDWITKSNNEDKDDSSHKKDNKEKSPHE